MQRQVEETQALAQWTAKSAKAAQEMAHMTRREQSKIDMQRAVDQISKSLEKSGD